MTDANITKEYNASVPALPIYETLTKQDRNKLAKMILGRNNLKAAYLACECSEAPGSFDKDMQSFEALMG